MLKTNSAFWIIYFHNIISTFMPGILKSLHIFGWTKMDLTICLSSTILFESDEMNKCEFLVFNIKVNYP